MPAISRQSLPSAVRLIFVVAVALCILGLIVVSGRYVHLSACDKCGVLRRTVTYEIPIAGIAVVERSEILPSAFSTMLEQSGLAVAHKHNWFFLHGTGRSKFGSGVNAGHLIILQNSVFAKRTSVLLSLLEPRQRAGVIKRILAPNDSAAVYERLLEDGLIGDKTITARGMSEWIQQHLQTIDQIADGPVDNR